MAWMTMREQATVCIDRKFTAEFDASAFDEAAALSLGTEAKVLELDYHDRREAIIKLGDVDIARPNSRHRVGAFACFFGGRRGQADGLADVLVPMALSGAEQINRLLLEVAGALGGGHNDCSAAVAYQGAIEQMERVTDHPRVEHVVDRDGLAHLRGRIHRRMVAACDGNGSALRCGGSIGVFVSAGQQGVKGGDRRTIWALELRMARTRHRLDRLVTRKSRQLAVGHRD